MHKNPLHEKLQRIAAGIEYGGVNYCGWQFQDNAPSVQAQVEIAIGRVANETVRVIAAGRTDTGVHGMGQVIHFATHSVRARRAWLRGVNTHLPDDISLLWVREVGDDFHARFGALERRYRYVIFNGEVSPAILHGQVTWHYPKLEVTRMSEAAAALIGRHDFSAYRAASCQSKDPHKTIRHITIQQSGAWIWLDITATGFLHHMVRNIAGTLMRIGEGREAVEWAGQLLKSRDRTKAAATAPADGLYFVGVQYDAKFGVPPPPDPCRFW